MLVIRERNGKVVLEASASNSIIERETINFSSGKTLTVEKFVKEITEDDLDMLLITLDDLDMLLIALKSIKRKKEKIEHDQVNN